MQSLKSYLLLSFVLLFFSGCEKDPAVFVEEDGLYFAATNGSFYYTFAKYPRKLVDTIQIPLNVFGNAAPVDRVVSLEKITSDEFNAVEGKHFKFADQVIIPANAFKGTIPVVFYRTPDLELNSVKFKLSINKNAAFPGSGITSQQSITVKLGYLQQPDTWGTLAGSPFAGFSGNFGTWTKTKYKLILDALYDEEKGETIAEFPEGSRFVGQHPPIYDQYVAIVRNYIRIHYPGNYGGTGAVLRDPDANNQLILVGPANY
ncbi:DUF4843 domain-containing protein [Pedobacter polysacchareus]|uniref:DUF4843 domain-containing protein n=1 Tax=Pedobacter polysacchareus TaxID=2861973 RepID=UPI001C99A558|nr:DUF4843 domain-containing protein [Pedobacter polysacchareus]